MSYAVQPPPAAEAPSPVPTTRPPAVTAAAATLWTMATVGLLYAVVTVAIVPGSVSRFRTAAAAGGRFSEIDIDPDSYVAVVWMGAAIALVLAIIIFALYLVLGLAIRRGSRTGRIATLVICALGILGGAGSALTVALERSGDGIPDALGDRLATAYPGGWIAINIALAVAQILGYALVAVLLLTAPRQFFGHPQAATPAPPSSYGMPYPGPHPAPPYPPSGFPPPTSGAHPSTGAAPYPPPGAPATLIAPGTVIAARRKSCVVPRGTWSKYPARSTGSGSTPGKRFWRSST